MRTSLKNILVVLVFITAALASCLPGASPNEYDLTKSVKDGKFPSAELDNIAYAVREAIERNHRWDTEWLAYWANAEMITACGRIKVDNLQVGESDTPLEPIDLQDVVSVEAWVEYHSFTESQLINSANAVPIVKAARGTLVYKDGGWRVKSAEEMQDSTAANCP